jgi:hypothetical protein
LFILSLTSSLLLLVAILVTYGKQFKRIDEEKRGLLVDLLVGLLVRLLVGLFVGLLFGKLVAGGYVRYTVLDTLRGFASDLFDKTRALNT